MDLMRVRLTSRAWFTDLGIYGLVDNVQSGRVSSSRYSVEHGRSIPFIALTPGRVE